MILFTRVVIFLKFIRYIYQHNTKNVIMKKLILGVFIGMGCLFTSCSNDNDTNDAVGNPKLSIRLTDAPASYEEVLIDLQEVRVHFSGEGEEEGGWQTLENVNTGVYNLLDFTNGVDTLIAEEEFAAGKI